MDREETYLKLPLKNNEPDWLPFDQNWLSGLEMANCHPLICKLLSLYGQGEEMHEIEWKGWRLFVCPDDCAVSCNFLMDIEEDADLIIDHGGLRITIQGPAGTFSNHVDLVRLHDTWLYDDWSELFSVIPKRAIVEDEHP